MYRPFYDREQTFAFARSLGPLSLDYGVYLIQELLPVGQLVEAPG
jgi:hypothetical protein